MHSAAATLQLQATTQMRNKGANYTPSIATTLAPALADPSFSALPNCISELKTGMRRYYSEAPCANIASSATVAITKRCCVHAPQELLATTQEECWSSSRLLLLPLLLMLLLPQQLHHQDGWQRSTIAMVMPGVKTAPMMMAMPGPLTCICT